jgi:hypothetical protein
MQFAHFIHALFFFVNMEEKEIFHMKSFRFRPPPIPSFAVPQTGISFEHYRDGTDFVKEI